MLLPVSSFLRSLSSLLGTFPLFRQPTDVWVPSTPPLLALSTNSSSDWLLSCWIDTCSCWRSASPTGWGPVYCSRQVPWALSYCPKDISTILLNSTLDATLQHNCNMSYWPSGHIFALLRDISSTKTPLFQALEAYFSPRTLPTLPITSPTALFTWWNTQNPPAQILLCLPPLALADR